MHPKNPYASKKPDFGELAKKYPAFAPFVTTNDDGYSSIDFQDPAALRALTTVLLKEDWGYDVEMREDRLCPTLANRLDYVLFLLDLVPHIRPNADDDKGEGRSKPPLRFLDIGTGAIAIYPLLLHHLDPACRIVATEIDKVSLEHAQKTLAANSIPEDRISLIKPFSDRILEPLFPSSSTSSTSTTASGKGFDFVLCNPPFFASEEEMKEGKELKEERPHAAPTAANNELITPGGEVAFVSQMIEESVAVGEGCRWYTSLVGKYSSLQSLLRVLERRQVDNYFIKSIKQAKTARWILGWSYTPIRLPDALTRPSNLIPGTSFARLLPPPNSFSHSAPSASTVPDLGKKIIEIFSEIHLLPPDFTPPTEKDEWDVEVAPKRNTWSRQARRAAARGEALEPESALPLFRARVAIYPYPPPAPPSSDPDGDGESKQDAKPSEPSGPIVSLDWLEGSDRVSVDALWKYVLNKIGFTHHPSHAETQTGQKRDRDEAGGGEGKREYPDGHWRGGPPGNRGFGRGRGRGGFDEHGGGRGRRGLGFGNRGRGGGDAPPA